MRDVLRKSGPVLVLLGWSGWVVLWAGVVRDPAFGVAMLAVVAAAWVAAGTVALFGGR